MLDNIINEAGFLEVISFNYWNGYLDQIQKEGKTSIALAFPSVETIPLITTSIIELYSFKKKLDCYLWRCYFYLHKIIRYRHFRRVKKGLEVHRQWDMPENYPEWFKR